MVASAQQIMDALRSQESGSGDDPDLQNATGSGAFGPWQMMPQYWPARAKAAGLPENAPKTLANQEHVVRNMIQGYLDQGYDTPDIAAIWYSGHPLGKDANDSQGGYPPIQQYSDSVVAKVQQGIGAQLTDNPSPVRNSIAPNWPVLAPGATKPATKTATTTPKSSDPDLSDYQDFLDIYVGPRPEKGDFTDQPGPYGLSAQQQYDAAVKDYGLNVKQATAGYSSYRTATGKGTLSPDQKAQNQITNAIAAIDAQVRAGELDATQARDKLNAFIDKQKNAIALGTQQQNANAQLDKYGPGDNWSYGEMGGAASQYAKDNGIDQSASGLNFKTPTPFDPAAAYNQNIQTMALSAPAESSAAPAAGSASANAAALLKLLNGAGTDTSSTIKPLPAGYGSTGGLGDATTPQNSPNAGVSYADAIAAISQGGAIKPLPQGYGATGGLGDASTPANSIAPYVPPWAGRVPAKVGG